MVGYFPLSVEIFIIIKVIVLLIAGIIIQENKWNLKYKFNIVKFMEFHGSLTLFFAMIILYKITHFEVVALNYQVIKDNLGFFLKFTVLLTSFLCLTLSYKYCEKENIKNFEYVLLLLLAVVGLLTIISSYDLITMYLGIELQSLCFYVVTNLKYHSNFSIEAGLKYFILGAISSCIILFGSSLVYGFTGMTNFLDLTALFYYYNLEGYNMYYYEGALIGIILIFCGVVFKIGVVPFHMWVSDIYEGAPTNIAFFFAVVPQISILGLLIRLNMIFAYAFLKELQVFFIFLSAVTIMVGTLGAIYQTKIKRILAFSGISNMGYILSALVTNNIEGIYSVILYMIIYNLISMGIWIFLLSFRNNCNNGAITEIGEVILLFKSNKYLSIIFFLFLFSAMGIPPMLGFFSKIFILLNVMELKMYFYAIFLTIFSSISVIYYLRVIMLMYSLRTDKRFFFVDLGDFKAMFLVLLVYLNIFFFFYPSHLLIFLHNIVVFLLS